MNGEQIRIHLKAARVNAGYAASKVAEIMGVTQTTVSNWETGLTEPTISQARKLAELYNMPLDCIIFLQSKSN